MQHFPVQTNHSPAPFAQQYQIVEVNNSVLSGNTIFQSVSSPAGAFLVPLQSHHIVNADGQMLISQEMPIISAVPFQAQVNPENSTNNSAVQQHSHVLHISHSQSSQILQPSIYHPVQQVHYNQTNSVAPEIAQQLSPQTILVQDSIVQPVLIDEAPIVDSQQPQFLVVNDSTAEVVEFTDAGTQTILTALSQGEMPAISINGDIVGYVNCAEIKSDGAIVFTIGGNLQPKSDITNFLELIDKKNSSRDAQSWFFDSVVATQAMQALIGKRPDIQRSALPVASIRRQVH